MPGAETQEQRTLSVDQHERQLQARGWPGVPELARKWGISRKLVRDISRDRLPFISFGQSDVRRYDPADIVAFEEREKKGVAA